MAAVDRVVIDINVDVDKSQLDKLITQLAALQAISEDLTHKFDGLARSSKEFNDGLRKSHSNIRNVNTEIDKAASKFDHAANKIKATNRELDDSNRKLKANADMTQQVSKQLDDHDRKLDRSNRSHRRFGRTIDRVIAPLKKFIMTLGKLSFVALAGQMGLFTLGLLSVKLALITGRAAVEVYNIALKGLSVTAAGVATAVSVAAAAMRQFNEAMLIPSVGGGMNRRGAQNAALLSRSLGSQTTGLLGGEATTSLIAAFAKAGVSRTATEGISRQLINLTGGDPAAVQAIAKAIGSKDSAELQSALSSAAGFRAGSLAEGLSTDQLLAALASGSIVSENYRGVGTGLAGTFIGTAKTEFSGMKNMFADMGQPLLNPFRESMMDMARIIRENFLGMSVLIQRFGADSFAPTLVTLVEKTMDFIRSNIFDHLENIKEMGEGFVGFFRSVRDFFQGMGAFLVQFEPAANVVLDMFRAMGATGGGRGLFRSFSDLIVKNAVAFQQFGASIGRVFGAIFDLLKSGQSGFFGRLELFAEIMNTVAAKIIPVIGKLLDSLVPVLEQIPNVLSGLAVVIEGITPVIATLAAVMGKLMGLGSAGGAAGGILGLLGFLALKRPGRTYERGRKAFDYMSGLRQDPAKALKVAKGVGFAAGGLAFGFGAYRNATRGATAEGNLSMMGGGAMMGAMYGGLPGAIAGALGGAFMASVVNLLGENARKGRVRDVLDAGAAVAAETTFTGVDPSVARARRTELGEVLAATRNIRTQKIDQANFLGQTLYEDDTNSLLFTIAQVGRMLAPYNPEQIEQEQKQLIDITDPNFMRMKKYAEDNLFMDFSDFSRDELTDAFAPGGEIQQLIQEDAMQLATELATLEGNLRILATRTGLVEDEVLVLADALGIDLYNAVLNASGAAAVFLAQTLPLMDRNRAALPGFNTSPLGQAELKATADAAFTSLVNADEITVDLVRDAVESFAAFDISTGTPADIAAFSAFAEINQKVMTVLTDPVKRAALRGEMKAGTAETAQILADRYGISYNKIMSFDTHGAVGGGSDGIIGSYAFEVAELNAFLNRQDAVRRGLNMSSGLVGSERLTLIEGLLGEELSGSTNLRRNILKEFGAAGDRFAPDADLSVIMKAAEEQGINTAQILVRTLAEEQLIGDDTVLSETRNNLLMEIRDGINEIDLPRRNPFNRERGPVGVPGGMSGPTAPGPFGSEET